MSRIVSVCSVEGCGRLVSRDGLCRPHYLSHVLKLATDKTTREGLPLGKLHPRTLEQIAARAHHSSPPPSVAIERGLKTPKRDYLSARELEGQRRHGPRPRKTCSRCEQMESRDGLCRYHWSLTVLGSKLRHDIAKQIPVERLTMDKLADLRERGMGDWRHLKAIAEAPYEPEPLMAEERRHRLRSAYRSATTCIFALDFGWTVRRIRRHVSPGFDADPRRDAPPDERIMIAISPGVAESLFLGRPIERHERHLWRAMEPHDAGLGPRTPDERAMAAIRESLPHASYEGLIAAFREHEVVVVSRVSEEETWRRISALADALLSSEFQKS